MKTRPTLAFMVLVLFLQIVNAQQKKSELHKNVNLRAKGLSHQLNSTQDSLLLKSDQMIYRVSFLYDGNRKAQYDNDSKKLNVSLLNLKRGKYTVLVYQESRIVVFGVTKSESDIISLASNLNSKKGTFQNIPLASSTTIKSSLIEDALKTTKKTYVGYSISVKSTRRSQTREEYRQTHLRPNGKTYDK